MSAAEEATLALLRLIRATEFQASTGQRLLTLFDDASSVCRGFSAREHGAVCGLATKTALTVQARLRSDALRQQVDADIRWLSANGGHFIPFASTQYPKILREIADPPLGLFCVGDLRLLAQPKLAVVGSRHPTQYGRAVADRLAGEMAKLGLVITSGMALGIDAVAHESGLRAKGTTIAVLGTGPDQVYPPQHERLYRQIRQQGLLVSEFPPGVQVASWHFPQRNRVVTGLSVGTLVVEARLRSGSLISARLAMEQGRDVFAVPGSVLSKLSEGCHQLLRDGAKLTAHWQDIVDELPAGLLAPGDDQQSQPSDLLLPPHLPLSQQRLLATLDHEVQHADRLAERLGISPAELLSNLVALELLGLVKARAGGYCLVENWT